MSDFPIPPDWLIFSQTTDHSTTPPTTGPARTLGLNFIQEFKLDPTGTGTIYIIFGGQFEAVPTSGSNAIIAFTGYVNLTDAQADYLALQNALKTWRRAMVIP